MPEATTPQQPYHPEPLPESYHLSRATREIRATDPNLAMLLDLRSEVVWAERGTARMDAMYAAARNLGDDELIQLDQTRSTFNLLDASRWHAYPQEYSIKEMSGGVVGSHSENRVLSMDYAKLDAVSKGMAEYLEAQGEPLRNNSDAYLLNYLHVAAHETGHAILSGVSAMEKSIDRNVDGVSNLATRTYLANHPEQAVTGNWETDVAIQEERFAEGYARMVSTKALAILGYTPQQARAVQEYMDPGFDVTEAPVGQHQLDHFQKVTGEEGIDTVMANNVKQAEGRSYKGKLGYSMPLTPDELVAQINDLSDLIIAKKMTAAVGDKSEWTEMVQSEQLPVIKEKLEQLKQKRAEALNPPQKAKRLARIKRKLGRSSLA